MYYFEWPELIAMLIDCAAFGGLIGWQSVELEHRRMRAHFQHLTYPSGQQTKGQS